VEYWLNSQTLLPAVALGVAVVALAVAVAATRQLASQRHSLVMLRNNASGQTLLDIVADVTGKVGGFEKVLRAQAKRQEELFALLGRSPRNVGVVRYDAFEDMGGRLSFSAALLDDHGTGLVITSINARAESRVYAKAVKGGGSEHNLSPEEQQAIAEALGSKQKVKG
jgi:hypothetical protein